jgi:hypothetical protein
MMLIPVSFYLFIFKNVNEHKQINNALLSLVVGGTLWLNILDKIGYYHADIHQQMIFFLTDYLVVAIR